MLTKKIKQPRLEILLLVAIAIAVLIRVLYAGGRELWYDEVLSLLLSTGQRGNYTAPPDFPVALSDYAQLLQLPPFASWQDALLQIKPLLQGIVGQEPHPPLFFLSQYVWLFIAGNGEAGLRSLNLGLSLLAIMGAFGMGRSLLGYRGGLVLAALLGLNPFFWFHSLNVRMYAPTVFWVTLSGWATLELYHSRRQLSNQQQWLWCGVLTTAIVGGLMTFYLYALWLVALGLLATLTLNPQKPPSLRLRRRGWQYGLCLLIGGLIVAPWYLWGLPQQLNNADLDRFSSSTTLLDSLLQHAIGVLEVVGTQLTVGDWAIQLPRSVLVIIGLLLLLGLGGMVKQLVQSGHLQQAAVALVLGGLPLLLALGLDVMSGRSTLAWGYGRSVIFILPGLLLLVTTWIVQLPQRWQRAVIMICLLVYLGLDVGDMVGRSRQVFHRVAGAVVNEPTLLVINSEAWGHICRLAYYLPAAAPVDLLATPPKGLPTALNSVLTDGAAARYRRVLWLEAHEPLWNQPETLAETRQIRQSVTAALTPDYRAVEQQELAGTMPLDRFTLTVYERS
ncbi:glycosyltransferase family 39 protein [Sphaerothrix gracilis]|uniref:glycosyltransferase family 39 protein n=1 Tax=Sphaerothrix gracilis TaxID=3151835 RepID=UPI0031FD06E8